MANRETSNEAPDDQQPPTQIVCVYDQFDQQWYDDLKTYLILWERARKITWLDIQAGADTAQTMETDLQRADLILLLLSPTFFASHPCYNAMLLALQEQEQRLVPVVPIIARACDWKESACGGLQALPDNERPIAEWEQLERAYENICVSLALLLSNLSPLALAPPESPRPTLTSLSRTLAAHPEAIEVLRTFASHTSYVRSVALSADGQTLASSSLDDTIKLWNAQTGQLLHTLTGHTDNVKSVALSADGQTLASGSYDHTIKLWNAQTGQLLRTLTGHTGTVFCVTLSADGQTLASGGSQDGTIKLWNVQTGQLLYTLTGQECVWSVVVSADGRSLASSSLDDSIKLWSAQTGHLLHTLSGHTHAVFGVSW